MTQLKSEIIAVGTELLLGQIANTNAKWISQQLAMHGIDVYYHTVVGDNLLRVQDQFNQSAKRSDIIIVTGGLGPTDDDLTREAFQNISNVEMVEHKESMNKIETYFKKQNRGMTPNNKKQARVFAGAHVIENNVGMAPGMVVSFDNKTWIFLPGVPKEMKSMVTNGVLPYLGKMTGDSKVIKSTMLKFIGIGEATLEHELSTIIKHQTNPTIAPLAQEQGVAIRLTAKADTMEKAQDLIERTQNQIFEKVGTYFFGFDEQNLEGKVFGLLKEKNLTIAAAESITGGMFTDKLIANNGASSVCTGGIVCYDSKVKENVLKVASETIMNQGTVSEECALEMAVNVRKLLGSDIGISFTGVAGPDATEGKPPGTVYIAVSINQNRDYVKKFIFHGERQTIRNKAVQKGYELLLKYVK
ncbi:competence/damage-inducible protein A [Virgibacillus oceani]|uniref:Putative competence-damage inducible protein n=1 Tax=Virgibacillus oceani TaxID=1479511 RepID=A0A917LZT8_9BACI|nr:competence/damage-inducible protein A [Virgibacillus oceani]GGG68547.1 putative competence-damage inducible protein [Virgibacillus oceani]